MNVCNKPARRCTCSWVLDSRSGCFGPPTPSLKACDELLIVVRIIRVSRVARSFGYRFGCSEFSAPISKVCNKRLVVVRIDVLVGFFGCRYSRVTLLGCLRVNVVRLFSVDKKYVIDLCLLVTSYANSRSSDLGKVDPW